MLRLKQGRWRRAEINVKVKSSLRCRGNSSNTQIRFPISLSCKLKLDQVSLTLGKMSNHKSKAPRKGTINSSLERKYLIPMKGHGKANKSKERNERHCNLPIVKTMTLLSTWKHFTDRANLMLSNNLSLRRHSWLS